MSLTLDATNELLSEGDHVHFEPVAATDYKLVYAGVTVHVHRARLMDRCPYFEAALAELSSEPLVIPLLTCPVLEKIEWIDRTVELVSSSNREIAELVASGQRSLRFQFRAVERTATAYEFVLMLAFMYWADVIPDRLLTTPRLELTPMVNSRHDVVANSYRVEVGSFLQKLPIGMQPFCAGFAWAHMWNSHLLNVSFDRMVEIMSMDDTDFSTDCEVVNWIWLCERYRAPLDNVKFMLDAAPVNFWLVDDSLVSKNSLRYELLGLLTTVKSDTRVIERLRQDLSTANKQLNRVQKELSETSVKFTSANEEIAKLRSEISWGHFKTSGSVNVPSKKRPRGANE